MQYVITELDKLLIQQKDIKRKIRITILSQDKKILGVLTGVPQIGDFLIDAESNVRRTTSLDIKLDDFYNDIEARIESYLNLDFLLEVGIYNEREGGYRYYRMGVLCITTANTVYDAVTNILSINLSDGFAKFDNTRNGQVGGSPTIIIPVKNGDDYNTLKTAIVNVIKAETTIKDYIIDDIGEYYGMPQNNEHYLEYRQKNPLWNVIPYDLEFSAGNTVENLLVEVRDLYPNCQLYFDIYNNLCFDMIPSNSKAAIVLSNDYLQSILLAEGSEDVQYDISAIKNVVEVFGKIYDVDRFCETATFSEGVYELTMSNFDSYQSHEMIAFTSPMTNPKPEVLPSYINVNSIGKIPLYEEYTEKHIREGSIEKDDTVVVRVIKNSEGKYIAYYLGQYQPHALCVLTENAKDEREGYRKKDFAEKFNCLEKNIAFVEVKDSPFSIQRLGTILDSKTGDEYENILSDSVALDNAKYLIYKSSVWNDVVTINTKMIPWLDVNIKVEYKKQQENDTHVYIVKKVSHNFESGTSSITMYRFSSLYQE
jgi:hypothetical protein